MCTCIHYNNRFFGRNLDLECSYGETLVVAPRTFDFKIPKTHNSAVKYKKTYAVMGVAHVDVEKDYPLFYDAMNEAGLAMAGLNFPDNAVYFKPGSNNGSASYSNSQIDGHLDGNAKVDVAPFQLIPYILHNCSDIKEAKALLSNLRIVDIDYNETYKATPLHWMIADENRTIVVEQMAEGLFVYDNPLGVMTNNPPFPYHMMNMKTYIGMSTKTPTAHFADGLSFEAISNGMGAIGLPGDFSSMSRFIKAAFVLHNSAPLKANSIESSVSQFMHILSSVAMPRGSVEIKDRDLEYTVYSSCYDLVSGKFYIKTYDNWTIRTCGFAEADLACEDRKLTVLDNV